ncbi:hypothetical protein ABVN74_01310 [Escherichia coli]
MGGENDSGEVEGLWRDHLWGRGQFRTVVAATSKSKAASILNITIYQMNSWWTETFNKYEVEAAMSEPGLFFQSLSMAETHL